MNQQEWNIKAAAPACQACRREFADQEAFFSRLSFSGGEYRREDVCAGCWTEDGRRGALSVWKSVFHVPPPPPPEPLKKETAESLLRQFMEEGDASKGNVIFILAVMLERRRILVERDVRQREDGVKVRLYEHRKTGESFVIPDPGLRLTELEQVQQEVLTLLGLKPSGEPAPAAEAPPAREADEPASES